MSAIRQEKLNILPATLNIVENPSRNKITLIVYMDGESERRVDLTLEKSRGIVEVSSRTKECLPCIPESYTLQRQSP